MTHTEMLEFIRFQLAKNGIIWKSEKELFEMLVKDEEWEKHRSKWDSWKNKKVQYLRKSFYILVKISETLGFDPSVWNARNDAVQKEEIKKAVKKFCKAQKTIDLSTLMPPDPPLTKEQKQILKEIKNLPKREIESFLEKYPKYFQAIVENQNFLLNLVHTLYQKGMYDFLSEQVFPALLPHNRADPKIRMLMAHTFGSLSKPKYLEAAKLLETIKSEENEELIDLKTSTISNIRRDILLNKNTSKEELKNALEILISHYLAIYRKSEDRHYYPAINIAYMIKIYELIFLEKFMDYDIEKLHKECKNSIEKDKNKKDDFAYYALISEAEFHLLMGKSVESEIYFILEELNPSFSLVDKSLRQMKFFLHVGNNFFTQKELLNLFEKTIDILEGYLKENH